jgi:cysteine desulfurase family protein (TIGR01976 family)
VSETWVQDCRRQFPGLNRQLNGQPMVFFDGPAGTQVPQRVIDAISRYLTHSNANHGGKFQTSRETDAMFAAANRALADFVGADDPGEIIWGQNMTSLTFSFSRALAREWGPGDEIIVTALDHDANVTPWVMAAQDRGATVHVLDFNRLDGTLDQDAYRRLLSPRTRLVALGCASNATGGVNPVGAMIAQAHAVGAQVFLDAVHYGPHALIDVRKWNCDFLACSTYKFFGPHLGVLWGRRSELERLTPYKVRPCSEELPWRWMTGTQSYETIAGALACVDYLADLGRQVSEDWQLERRPALAEAMQAIETYEMRLAWRLIEGLQRLDGIRIYGITEPSRTRERFSTVSFTHERVSVPQLNRELAARGICVWGGHYYALEFARRMGLETEGMIRVGLLHYNTEQEVDRFLRELAEIIESALVVEA